MTQNEVVDPTSFEGHALHPARDLGVGQRGPGSSSARSVEPLLGNGHQQFAKPANWYLRDGAPPAAQDPTVHLPTAPLLPLDTSDAIQELSLAVSQLVSC